MKLFFVSALILFTLFSCRKETTMWYSDWVLPLVNDTLDLQNLTNDSTLTIENGIYAIDLQRKIASIKPSEYIQIPDTLIEQKFAISISSLTVPAGTSFVNNNKDHIFDLGEVQLKKARVKTGKIYLEVFNPVPTITFFEIQLPSVSLNNQTISKILQVPAGTVSNPQSSTIEIDLASYEIDMTGTGGNNFNALRSILKVSSDPNGGPVVLNATDSTRFLIRMENIQLDYAQGYFGQHIYSNSYSFESAFLKNQVQGALDVPALNFQIDFQNGIKTSAKANLKKLNNINSENASQVNLTSPVIGNPFVVETATGSWNTLTSSFKQVNFDEGNSNLEAFIENLGETTEIEYEIELNPWGNISGGWDEFFPNSSFDITVHAQMPLNIALDHLVLSDTFTVDFVADPTKTHVESGNLHLKIENAFPFEGQLKLYFYDANDQLIYSINDINTIFSANSGTMTSFGILSRKSELTIPFPVELLDRLGEIKKIHTSMELNTPNPFSNVNEVISIPEKAFFKLKIQSSFKLENHIGQ